MSNSPSSYQDLFEAFKKSKEERKSYDRDSKILIIDGLNTFIRSFAVVPTRNDDGLHIGGIGGCLKSIGAAIRKFNPTRCVIVFDGKGGSTKRKQIFGGYKSGRSSSTPYNRNYDFENEDRDEAMSRQVQRTLHYLEACPVTLISMDFVEADDVMAYVCQQLYPEKETILMSSDRDFLQLVSENTKVWSPTKKKVYDREKVLDEYGVPPRNMLVRRVVEGDKSDSIPGVKYVGEKRIQEKLGSLIHREGDAITATDLLAYCEDRKDESATYQRLLDHKDVIVRNWQLMQLQEVDISPEMKGRISNLMEADIGTLQFSLLQKYFMEDKLWASIKNFKSWVSETFKELNRFAQMTH